MSLINVDQLYIVEPSHPVLSQVAEEVKTNEITSQFIQDLIKKMMQIAGVERENPGKRVLVGLAAPQIGVSKRIILVDTGANGKGGITNVKVYINPKIISKSAEETEWYEACFSTGQVAGIVMRPKIVTIVALNEKGDEVTETHADYVARIFQHEIDHLDGKRFPSLIKDEQKLHWVEKDEFPIYRNQEGWRDWPKKCPKEKWEAIQKGETAIPSGK
jgi:peptide deformylase